MFCESSFYGGLGYSDLKVCARLKAIFSGLTDDESVEGQKLLS